jgi:hypothetical protein
VQRGHPDLVFLQRAVSPEESVAFVEPGQGIGLTVEAGEGEFQLARPAMAAEETVTESAAAVAAASAPATTAAAGTLGLRRVGVPFGIFLYGQCASRGSPVA